MLKNGEKLKQWTFALYRWSLSPNLSCLRASHAGLYGNVENFSVSPRIMSLNDIGRRDGTISSRRAGMARAGRAADWLTPYLCTGGRGAASHCGSQTGPTYPDKTTSSAGVRGTTPATIPGNGSRWPVGHRRRSFGVPGSATGHRSR